MKKLILPLLLLVAFGMLAAVESDPSEIVGYVKYPCVTGWNFNALPMDQGYTVISEVAGDYPAGNFTAVNYFDSALQSWAQSDFYDMGDPAFNFWDPDFSVGNGTPLWAYATTPLNFYSIGSLHPTNAQYSLAAGFNTIMIPLNKSNITDIQVLGDNVGTLTAILRWDSALQSWAQSDFYDMGDPAFNFWDPMFDTTIGMPLWVYSSAATVWPASPRGASVFGTTSK
ncbi:MAG: hypothetical protein BWX83_00429 [Candidatus Cloacimonetes bacterium ADurb.Bin117]|jgi:hypothetical protein|nr:MAG: hypothetical protein BWX83_00429 [Candidatus Cloacimonetes bacterium ADurb.Bin117]HQC47879.1 hypothetical protein [Candidatus Syntrophosphaera sp.]